VERAALAALEALGAGPGADVVEQRLQSSDSGVARQALAALLQVDPERGAVALTASVAASDPAVVQQAAELALAWRHPLVVPVLFGLVNEGSRAERAMSALAELDGGAGLPVLMHVARENAQHASTARHALAMALRRWAPALSRASAETRSTKCSASRGPVPGCSVRWRATKTWSRCCCARSGPRPPSPACRPPTRSPCWGASRALAPA
jgi:hypothetical protein